MEEETCELCEGTGVVPTYGTDPDSHQLVETGTKECSCKKSDFEE